MLLPGEPATGQTAGFMGRLASIVSSHPVLVNDIGETQLTIG
jgi:hypothetical protein